MTTPDTAPGAAPEHPAGFGAALRSAREQAGRTVEQVAAATRLRPGVLRDLERGELASCGGPAYARGHVRSIARVLGADPEPLLTALELEQHLPAPVLAEAVPLQVSRSVALAGAARVPERRGPQWGVAAVAALAVLVVLLAVGTITGGGPRRAAPADDLFAQAPPRAGAAARPAPPPAPAPPRPAARAAARGAALRLQAVGGSSWVRVQGSGGTVFEGMLSPAAPPREFRDARELRLLLGNAAAVRVSCGARQVPPSGAAGEVRRFTCSAQGLAAA